MFKIILMLLLPFGAQAQSNCEILSTSQGHAMVCDDISIETSVHGSVESMHVELTGGMSFELDVQAQGDSYNKDLRVDAGDRIPQILTAQDRQVFVGAQDFAEANNSEEEFEALEFFRLLPVNRTASQLINASGEVPWPHRPQRPPERNPR